MVRPKLRPGEKRTETIYALLKPKEIKELDRLAKAADLSRSATVRAAINEYVSRRGQKIIAHG